MDIIKTAEKSLTLLSKLILVSSQSAAGSGPGNAGVVNQLPVTSVSFMTSSRSSNKLKSFNVGGPGAYLHQQATKCLKVGAFLFSGCSTDASQELAGLRSARSRPQYRQL